VNKNYKNLNCKLYNPWRQSISFKLFTNILNYRNKLGFLSVWNVRIYPGVCLIKNKNCARELYLLSINNQRSTCICIEVHQHSNKSPQTNEESSLVKIKIFTSPVLQSEMQHIGFFCTVTVLKLS
jgi:hypothetical protein